MKKILRSLVPVALGVSAAFGVAQLPASASTLITVRIDGGTLIQTPAAHLHVGEVLHLGLNGEAFTVIHVQSGSTLAWVSPSFPKSLTGRTVVMSTS